VLFRSHNTERYFYCVVLCCVVLELQHRVMVRQMGTSVMEKHVASTVRNELIHDAVPTDCWHLMALQPTRNTILMAGTQGTVYTPSTFTLSLSSTFAPFFSVFILVFIFRFRQLTSVSFSLLPSSIRVVLTLSLLCFLPRRKINGKPTRRTRGISLTTLWRESYADEFS
jgi:hypothetical protein